MLEIQNSRRRLRIRAPAALGLGGALLLAACASTPPPTATIQSAEQAIAAADRTRVADSVSPELSEAREKLAAANTAVQAKHMVEADRLAQESRIDAELASAKIEAAKAKAVNAEMQHSTDTLTQEMQRTSGATQ
jgi:Domain of unknown function (DUF4398)